MCVCKLLTVTVHAFSFLNVGCEVCVLRAFCGNECSLALLAGTGSIHGFDVKQVILIGLQDDLLFTGFNTWYGSRSHISKNIFTSLHFEPFYINILHSDMCRWTSLSGLHPPEPLSFQFILSAVLQSVTLAGTLFCWAPPQSSWIPQDGAALCVDHWHWWSCQRDDHNVKYTFGFAGHPFLDSSVNCKKPNCFQEQSPNVVEGKSPFTGYSESF